jgi:hypothetical protein
LYQKEGPDDSFRMVDFSPARFLVAGVNLPGASFFSFMDNPIGTSGSCSYRIVCLELGYIFNEAMRQLANRHGTGYAVKTYYTSPDKE